MYTSINILEHVRVFTVNGTIPKSVKDALPIQSEGLEHEPSFEFRADDETSEWLYELARLYVPHPSPSGRGNTSEVYPADPEKTVTEFVRCRWHPEGDRRWCDLSVSRSNRHDDPYYEVDLHVAKGLDPVAVSCATVSLIRVFSKADFHYAQFISERIGIGMEPSFTMELHRSGSFVVVHR